MFVHLWKGSKAFNFSVQTWKTTVNTHIHAWHAYFLKLYTQFFSFPSGNPRLPFVHFHSNFLFPVLTFNIFFKHKWDGVVYALYQQNQSATYNLPYLIAYFCPTKALSKGGQCNLSTIGKGWKGNTLESNWYNNIALLYLDLWDSYYSAKIVLAIQGTGRIMNHVIPLENYNIGNF